MRYDRLGKPFDHCSNRFGYFKSKPLDGFWKYKMRKFDLILPCPQRIGDYLTEVEHFISTSKEHRLPLGLSILAAEQSYISSLKLHFVPIQNKYNLLLRLRI